MARPTPGDLQTDFGELWQMVVKYVKQELTEPIRGIGRFMKFGAIGTLLLTLGGIFLSLGVLRVLQTETDGYLDNNLSFVPYLASLLSCCLLAGLAVWQITRRSRRKGSKS